MDKVAVLLSGCGVFDGTEINEAVLTLLSLEEHGIQYSAFAPDRQQHHVINHITGEEMDIARNVLVESARIVRGNIQSLSELNPTEFKALLVVGGFGVAKNLSDFAFKGAELSIQNDVMDVCTDFKDQNKPAGYMCIAPTMLPLIYGTGIKATIGNDKDTASAIESNGGQHISCEVDGVAVDKENRVVSTPAYMLAENLIDAKKGIDKLVGEVKAMMHSE